MVISLLVQGNGAVISTHEILQVAWIIWMWLVTA
jgi:hypothetical protein